jgi:twitching motility protein PilT
LNGKTHQLYSVLEVSRAKWMILMDQYLLALYSKKIISKETLISFVRDKDSISLMI